MKTAINFGKIDYLHSGKKNCIVEVEIEMTERIVEDTFHYYSLSINGAIYNSKKTKTYLSGRCLNTIKKYRDELNNVDLFDEIYGYWKNYHMNDFHAGTPEQEIAVKTYELNYEYDFNKVCDYLKKKNIYEVPFYGWTTSKKYNGENYRYGSGWVVNVLPEDVERRIFEIIGE